MITFENDYSCGAHPKVLQRLCETNLIPQPGYGFDCFSERAREKIRAACGCPEAEIFFLSGGTQTNAVVLASLLKPWEGVVAAQTGHIHVHEAGAPEALGAKILALPEHAGKLDPAELRLLAATLRNTEPSIPWRNSAQSVKSAAGTRFPFIWTEPGWPTAWRPGTRTWICL